MAAAPGPATEHGPADQTDLHQPTHEPPEPEAQSTLSEIVLAVLSSLREQEPAAAEGVPPALHYLPPYLYKSRWVALGDQVAARERACGALGHVVGERWISLRLDGSGFSSAVRNMRKLGVLEASGFSERFAEAMVACTRSLMVKVGAMIGYTQSDELVVFIPPTSIVRGMRQPHNRNGRVMKIATLAAGHVTACFVLELSKMVLEAGGNLDGLGEVLPHFDCRMGHWKSWEEAQGLLLWRGYDCSVNGVSDAVHHSGVPGKKKGMTLNARDKVAWLHDNNLLPLPRHQAYGTVLTRVKRREEVKGADPRRPDEIVSVTRSKIEQVNGPVLELARTCGFYLEPDHPSDAELATTAARAKATIKGDKSAKKAAREQARELAA